ncbi:hypothetical protein QA811_43225 [Streptomyces sp. B21-102]|uniref:hypothetical protein n=1 Tax=Streptomyces sp. B21-102 TaxID=3039416 RepID=UPI002FF3A4B9
MDSVPVYSAHSGNPCYHSTGFTDSVCTMAYKWHLDYVVDAHANAMAYYYAQDTNYYGQQNGARNVSYIRDSSLTRIDYGFRDGGAYGTVPNQVAFTTAARCTLTTCAPLSASTAATQYPDVPYDLVCASGANCTAQSPSFFSTVRLASIKVQQYSVAAAKYQAIDTYTLHQSEPATGDGTSPTLWLSSITREGDDTTAGGSASPISMPDVTFAGVDLKNRVDTANFPGLYRYRISGITNELGGLTTISYDLPDACTASYVATADPKTNTKSCYPVSWTPKDYLNPITDWFAKYAVTQVLETDSTGGALAKRTNYTYNGGAAWHHDDNEVVKAKYRTWGQFRGYASVETRTGDGSNDPQTKTVTSYYRGMDDDWLSSSSRRSVNVTDSQGGVHPDSDQLAGNELETTDYTGAGGSVDNSTVTSYWISAATATRARTGLPALTAHTTDVAETWSRQAVTSTGNTTWRVTQTDNTYDATPADDNFGLLTYSYTHTVPADPAYDQCTAITYAKANTSANLVGFKAAQETDSVACAGFSQNTPATVPKTLNTLNAPSSVSRPDQVVSATRTYYDDTSFATAFPQAAAPTKGDVTLTRQASGFSGGAFTWQTQSRATYDPYGRPADSYDAGGNKTIAGYTVDSVGLTTGTTITNAKNQTARTTSDPTRGLILTTTDLNGITDTVRYDALGRTTAVWQHNRLTTAPADAKYTYTVTPTGQSGTTAQTLNDSLGYVTSHALVDSLGRPRQTQTPTPQGGRLIAESFYDSHGWVWKKNNPYWDANALPALATASAQDSQIPSQDRYTFDGLGRVVVDDSQQNSVLKQKTTTVYSGDATTVIPPTGATVKTTRTDPLGRTSEIDSYSTRPTLTIPLNTFTGTFTVTGGTSNAIAYGYDGHGKQNTVTSKDSTWTTAYDLLGRVTSKTDPDAGTTGMSYDAAGNLTQTTDARNKSVSYTYDVLNRKTGQYASTVAAQARRERQPDRRLDLRQRQHRLGRDQPDRPDHHHHLLQRRQHLHHPATRLQRLRRIARPVHHHPGRTRRTGRQDLHLPPHLQRRHRPALHRQLPPRRWPAQRNRQPRLLHRPGPAQRTGHPLLRLRPEHHLQRLRPGAAGDPGHGHQPGLPHQHLRPPHRRPDRPVGDPLHRRPHLQGRRAELHPRPRRQHHQTGHDPHGRHHGPRNPVLPIRRTQPAQPGLDRHRRLHHHSHHQLPHPGRRPPRWRDRLLDQLGRRRPRPAPAPSRTLHHWQQRHHHQLRLRLQRQRHPPAPRSGLHPGQRSKHRSHQLHL